MKARGWSIVGILVLATVLLFGLYLLSVLSWSYSDGERAGILQKLSRKGWFCKTHEGELAISIVPGVTPVIWNFSVRDESQVREPRSRAGQARGLTLHRASRDPDHLLR